MTKEMRVIPEQELARQREYAALVKELLAGLYEKPPLAFVHTFGCQGNEADSERMRGMLGLCGFGLADDAEAADLILFNTCAIREHAEDRVFGNVGRLKTRRLENKKLRVALCGCMAQQPHAAAKFRQGFHFVDLVFGTHNQYKLPELLYRMYAGGRRVYEITGGPGGIAEDLPVQRASAYKAWLPVMYGCDNFCSYCVVPLVRGRERSRAPEIILKEARALIAAGYREITLLGQNVNSYASEGGASEGGASEGYDFPRLLCELDSIEGDYWLRFVTSHPKDCSAKLLEVMARGRHIARHIHLPVQSGNDRILREMNRRYTREDYLHLTALAREFMPDISITSDIIVGFPGETYEEFKDTLSLVEEVGFTSLFTFIYSPREGTRAATLPDPVPHNEKVRWFQELTALQEQKAAARCASMPGRTLRLLCEGSEGKRLALTGRSEGNQIVEFDGPEKLIGQFVTVEITKAHNWLLDGQVEGD